MGKIIYITEDIAAEMTESIKPLSDIPQDIKNVLRNHKTSLGTHPSFPPDEENSFDYTVTKERFDEVVAKINSVNISNFNIKSLKQHLYSLIEKCKDIEKDFKDRLENICYNYIIDLFRVPDGLVSFKCNLVEKVNADKAKVKNTEAIDFENIKHRTRLHDAVYKRRLINALITGGAFRLSWIDKKLIGELYDLSKELPSLYRDIIIINDYLLFAKNNTGITEKDKKQSGISYLTIGDENTKNKITVEAEIFPVMLFESVKGFLEMFAAYGLPSSKKDCKYVLSKADFINAEPWDMRLGPELWDYLMDSLGNPETEELPMLLTILFSQGTEKFNMILQEIFGKTRRGQMFSQKIIMKAQENNESDDFEDLMLKKQTDVSIISDGYFSPHEL